MDLDKWRLGLIPVESISSEEGYYNIYEDNSLPASRRFFVDFDQKFTPFEYELEHFPDLEEAEDWVKRQKKKVSEIA